MESYNDMLERHRRRWGLNGVNNSDEALNEGIENFNDLIDNMLAPTVHKIKRTNPYEIDINNLVDDRVLVSDVSRTDNDITDKKLFNFKLSSNVACGCYVYWSKEWWLIQNEENNSFQTHNTFVAKKCNLIINYQYKNTIYRYPISIKNLTLYSDGLVENVNLTLADSKRSMLISKNAITETIKTETRIMLNGTSVFRTTLIDDFTTKGIYGITLLQDIFNSKDDKENNLAWNDYSIVDEEPLPTDIIGDDVIYLGDTVEYKYNGAISWEIESVDNCLSISPNGDICEVTCNYSSKYANTIATLIVNGSIKKEIKIKGVF